MSRRQEKDGIATRSKNTWTNGILYGILDGMRNGTMVSIDSAGRLVLPKSIREAAGIVAAAQLEIRLTEDGAIELRPRARDVRIEERKGVYVAVPSESSDPLTEADVELTRDRIRKEREDRVDGPLDDR